MGVAALISWLVTALFSLRLAAIWLAENHVTHRAGAAALNLDGAPGTELQKDRP